MYLFEFYFHNNVFLIGFLNNTLKKTFVIITLKQIMHHAKLTSMCEKLKKLRPYKSWSKGRSEEIESM